ncbi:MAG TPA: isoleucine--tRNA ligase [Edaphocola sp.]|nr:isoleucine--tRNA ligase [Edaphocola sp.]
MSAKYLEYNKLDMPAIEQEWLAKWDEGHYFKKSIQQRKGHKPFVFFEGPPSANGLPGIHHLISRTLKDLICRYKTMQGFQVNRKAGWDTHGLPVELGVEKELGITKVDIGTKISVEEYNRKCREAVMRYKDLWDKLTRQMGYWVDLDTPYVTFENKYIETLWWALKELFNKGLLYKSVSIQPYSPAAGTGLSSHELNQPGTYRDVKDTTCVAMFKVLADEKSKALFGNALGNTYFIAWTTTPWTLPSNAALTVGPDIDYVLVQTFNPYTREPVHIVMAKALTGSYFKAEGQAQNMSGWPADSKILPWKVVSGFKGKALEGCRYEQLMPFDSNRAELSGGDPFRVILGDFVTTEDGTGIVHTAPAFGADDFKVGKANDIGIFILVDKQGKFVEGTGEYAGRYVKDYRDEPGYKDVNLDIALALKQSGRVFKVEKYEHSYPHCWRTDKPVIYYPLDAWFIKTTALKEQMVALNKTINWKPKATGEGRFGNWLENMVDWNLSRSRFWGTPLPVWATEDGAELKCIGSVAELTNEYKKACAAGYNKDNGFSVENASLVIDLHKPYVDRIILVSESGKPMRREPDLVDVWFDSGAMPYAQWHFPFENKETFAENYPADFIAEGVDQTRGWFYTLHALGVLLKDSVHRELEAAGLPASDERYPGLAYRTVISNGLVLDKNGNKMSKRIGNVVDPFKTLEKYSADATRWYLITNAAPWESLRFDENGIAEVQRKFFGTVYNTYQFFALYANVDRFSFREEMVPLAERPEMDRWILSALNTLIKQVTTDLDNFEPTQAGRAIEQFVDEQLSNWYVRLCRRRFWKGDYEQDKISAYQTLYQCLETLSLLIAPVSPFFADWLYNNLNAVTQKGLHSSVHLADYPKADGSLIDKDLEERMQLAQTVSSLVLSLRKKEKIKVRQPLQRILMPVLDEHLKAQIEKVQDIILSEVNVKELRLLTDADSFISKKVKPDFKKLGKRAGSRMKELTAEIDALGPQQIQRLESGQAISVDLPGESFNINPDEVTIIATDIPGWSVAGKDSLTVALDIQLTSELVEEGSARELINRIQKLRKDQGFDLTDRILVHIRNGEALKDTIMNYNEYIRSEILADTIDMVSANNHEGVEVEVNDSKINVFISKKV